MYDIESKASVVSFDWSRLDSKRERLKKMKSDFSFCVLLIRFIE